MSRAPISGRELHNRRLRGRRVLVLGLGRFGGGVETARYLIGEGASVVISDTGTRERLAEPAALAEGLGATLVFGPQTPDLLVDADFVVASPAIPFDHAVLEAAKASGIPATTEVAFVLARAPCPVFGVTGTKGKSTTTSLLAALLSEDHRTVHLGGNIGTPLISRLPEMQAKDLVVLELSSFQLWWAGRYGLAPRVSLLTNLFPDHLDRHGTFANYASAKREAFVHQGPDDVAVLPQDDAAVRKAGFEEAGQARRIHFGTPEDDVWLEGDAIGFADGRRRPIGRLGLVGKHNQRNLLAALAASEALTRLGEAPLVSDLALERAREVRPLPHRLDPVGEHAGVLFVDDSNATNPQSTIVALDAMDRPTVLILGGKDKGAPRDALMLAIRAQVKAVVTIGSTGPELAEALAPHLRVASVTGGMTEAVEAAATVAESGDVVLLSPAFSSLDQYPSFAIRGQAFREAVEALDT